jgi:hypothetical protein
METTMLDRTDRNRLDEAGNARFGIGGNHPPGMIELAQGTISALADYLRDHPVISTEEEAREAKLLKDRADLAIKDMEDERDRLVRPLNTQVAEINGRYRPVRDPLTRVIAELKGRLTKFVQGEERRRQALAEAAQRVAAEKALLARQAEEAERAAKEEAEQGVCDVDVGGAITDADHAFADYEKAERTAARAERDTHVKIGGGFGRALSQRTHEVLTITDVHAAIDDMGLTEPLREAILTAARAYRKAIGELPDGIVSHQERSL